LARIKSILRRSSGTQTKDDNSGITNIGKLQVNFSSYEAYMDEEEVKNYT